MKKTIVFILALLLSWNCAETKLHTEKYRNQDILVGKGKFSALKKEPYQQWFFENAGNYTPSAEIIQKLRPEINKYNFLVIMGTWCPDSREQVPVLYKVLKESQYKNLEKIPVIYVPRKYKTYPAVKNMNLKRVPTIIVYENKVEKGRIIEYPMESIEQDLWDIIRNRYSHELEK